MSLNEKKLVEWQRFIYLQKSFYLLFILFRILLDNSIEAVDDYYLEEKKNLGQFNQVSIIIIIMTLTQEFFSFYN